MRICLNLCGLSLALALSACVSSTAPQTDAAAYASPRTFVPFVSGHRGGSAYAPEDTMTSYRNAARLGIDDLETDTQLTADGELVLIHDATLDRTTNCSGNVIDHSYAEIAACDAGYWWTYGQDTTAPLATAAHPFRGRGVTVPKAAELFVYAKSLGVHGPSVTIEIKNQPGEANYQPMCIDAADKLLKLIHDSGIQERITVQSFDPTCLGYLHGQDSTVKTLYLTPLTALANLVVCTASGFTYSSPDYTALDFNAAYISAAHAASVKVNPYTVDIEADQKRVSALGVDGIITNYPACLMEQEGRSHTKRLLSIEADPAAADVPACRSS